MDIEPIGRRPAVLVNYCPRCDLVVLPGAALAEVIEFPRSSQDRRDLA
jgi:Zn-finger nucleic acid-binding protein